MLSSHYSNRLQYARAVECAIWGMPIVAFDAMRQAFFRDARANYGDVVFLSKPADWKFRVTTPSNSVLYVYFNFNTSDGPVVVDVPATEGAGLYGSFNNAWQRPIGDIGPEGNDQGEGAKYLILSPLEQRAIPDGYIPLGCETFNGYGVFRVIPKTMAPNDIAKAIALIKKIRIYPISKEATPPIPKFIDMQGKLFDGIVQYDESFFVSLARMIGEERIQPRDLVMTPFLRAIGIEKGKEFHPDSKMRELFRAAIQEARRIFMDDVLDGKLLWPESQWLTVGPGNSLKTSFSFVEPTYYDIDARAAAFFAACAPPIKMGKASYYVSGVRDEQGEPFMGGETYRLRVPAKVPAKQFWSVTVYDLENACFITDSKRQTIDSFDSGVQKNSDGSVDVYFGPTPPEGKDSNWIKTESGKPWFMFFRFYGPEKPVFDQSWSLPDVERYEIDSHKVPQPRRKIQPPRAEPSIGVGG